MLFKKMENVLGVSLPQRLSSKENVFFEYRIGRISR